MDGAHRLKEMISFVLAGALIAAPAYAQTAAKRGALPAPAASADQVFPLESVTIKGNQFYTQQQIVAASGLKIGMPVAKAQFDAARDRLVATGAFQSVAYEFAPASNGKGYAGTFEVVEVEQRYPLRFERLPATDAQLRAVLKQREPLFGSEIPGTEQVLARVASDLQEYLAPRGLKDKVIGKIGADKPGALTIVFRPATPAPAVAEVRFTGNEVLPNAVLHNALTEVAVGVAYSETIIRELLDTSIRPLYEARGRMRVSFPAVTAEKAKGDVEGVAVTVQVAEGPSFNLGKVRFDSSVIPGDELEVIAKLKTGDVANFDAVKAAAERIRKRFYHDGYMHAETRVDRNIDDKAKTVDILVHAVPGPQFLMGKLDIQGLDIESEPVMRKLWSMKEGKPYNGDYPQMFLQRVQEEGYFDNLRGTRFDQQINEAAHTVDVTLFFKGGPDPNQQRRKRGQDSPQPTPGADPGGWPPWD
jgi:outer membrane protein assembly factor BamA